MGLGTHALFRFALSCDTIVCIVMRGFDGCGCGTVYYRWSGCVMLLRLWWSTCQAPAYALVGYLSAPLLWLFNHEIIVLVALQLEEDYFACVGVRLKQRVCDSISRLIAQHSSEQHALSAAATFHRLSGVVFSQRLPPRQQTALGQVPSDARAMHLPTENAELQDAARFTAAHYRFKQLRQSSDAALQVPVHAGAVGLGLRGGVATAVRKGPLGSVAPLEGVHPVPEGLGTLPHCRSHRGIFLLWRAALSVLERLR